ncbi:MAG: enoyl-CoA hydratase-related protein [Sphingobium sp.]
MLQEKISVTEKPEGVGRLALLEIMDGNVALVTLNRPDKRNAFNVELALSLQWIVRHVEENDAIRVGILTSSLESTFSAGADLSEIAAGRGHLLAPDDEGLGGFTARKGVKPWIAAVRGTALGGGCELTLACDMIVAADDAKFGLTETKRGLFAGGGGVYRLPRVLPRNVALELIATGDLIDAVRAHQLGMVNRLAPSEGVIDAARELARAVAAAGPLAVRESLRVARAVPDHDEATLRQISSEGNRIVFASEDAKEGPKAFFEKRAPVWQGR